MARHAFLQVNNYSFQSKPEIFPLETHRPHLKNNCRSNSLQEGEYNMHKLNSMM